MIHNLRFGTDAEFFLRTKLGQPFPVTGLIGGTKEEPKQIPGLPEGFMMQEDNSALEFNIPPSGKISETVSYLQQAFDALTKLLPSALEIDGEHASVELPTKYVNEIPQLNVFGCEPDYNVWKMFANDKPEPITPGFRSAAAHVHLGWDDPDDEDRLEIIRLSDIFVSMQFLPHENASEIARRSLYGKAGAFRIKPYGVEHRVISNLWVTGAKRVRSTLKQYLKAVAALNVGIRVPEDDYDRVESIINKHDLDDAAKYSAEFKEKILGAKLEDWHKEVMALEDAHLN